MAFSHLHVHTEYSLLDGMSTVNELLTRAKELNLSGLAITDHGTMMGAREFYEMAKKEAPGIKPIIGDEVYVTDGYDHRIKDEDNHRTFHLILLAKNLTGYKNLCKIASIGAMEGNFRNKARVCLEVVREHHEGLICLSACIGGEVPSYIIDDDLESAEDVILTYHEIFGDDYYLEVSEHPNDRPGNPQQVYLWQRKTTDALLKFGRRLGIKVVATNDSHFTYKSQADAHDVMLAMNCGKTVSDPTRLHFTGEEYLKSEEEMLAIFAAHPEVVWNTQEICDKVEVYDLEDNDSTPCPPVCKEGETPERALARLTKDGFARRYKNDAEAYKRLNYELSVISDAGYAKDFLFWYDIVSFAASENIMLGPGRGKAPGSIVNYCLGITQVDPLAEGLLFERFLNPEQVFVCNPVDFDVEEGGIGKIWSYICELYGPDHVAGLVSFNRLELSEIFRKVATAMELSPVVIDEAVRLIEENRESGDFQLMLTRDACLRKVYDIARELSYRKYSKTTNPCAIIVSTRRIADSFPVCIGPSFFDDSQIPLIQYSWPDLDETGLFRINILSLKPLNIIKQALKEIGDINLNACVLDSKTEILLKSGDTDGVFQFESELALRSLQGFKNKLEEKDVLAIYALCRPGLMDRIEEYRTNSCCAYDKYGLSEFDEIVAETNGILVYQEQGIVFFEKFLEYSPFIAVKKFRALQKKRDAEIRKVRFDFRNKCRDRGVAQKVSDRVWREISDSAMLIMPKSHLICYEKIALVCAYLKAHHRDVYIKYYTQFYHDS